MLSLIHCTALVSLKIARYKYDNLQLQTQHEDFEKNIHQTIYCNVHISGAKTVFKQNQ